MMTMLGLGFIELLLLALVIFGIAVARKRMGVAAIAAGLLIVCLLLPLAVGMLWFLARTTTQAIDTQVASTAWVAGPAPHSAPFDVTTSYASRAKISFVGVFLLLGGAVAVAVAMLRRGTHCAPGARWWPMLLIPLVPVLFLFGTYRSARHVEVRQVATQELINGTSQMAQVHTELTKRIATGEIHQLMDETDRPRIALTPEAPVAVQSAVAIETVKTEDLAASHEHTETQAEAEPPVAKVETAAELDAAVENIADADVEQDSSAHIAEDQNESASQSHAAENAAQPEATPDAKAPVAGARPAWVNDPPKRIGPVWREVVEAGPFATTDECYQAANLYLQLATYDHLSRLVGMQNYAEGDRPQFPLRPDFHSYDSRINTLASIGVGIDYIRREIAKDEYVETVEQSFGPMKKLYTLVDFAPVVDRELRLRWDAHRRQERFAVVGLGAGSVLGLLGMVWGLLKFDTATKGYYTKQLFFGVPLGILGLLGVYVLLMFM